MFNNIYNGKKVLVTGHTGFKGSWLTLWLLQLGAEVAGYSIGVPTTPSNFEILGLEKQIKYYQGDIHDRKALKKTFAEFRPDIVFHLAAQPLVRHSYNEPVTTFETNAIGTMNVLECIRQCDSVQVGVFITSDKCYRNLEWTWGYRENDIVGGEDPYSASKGCAELIIYSYIHSFFLKGPRVASTRAGNVIGGGDWAEDRIVPDCMRAWSQGEPVTIRNHFSTRPWQHVLEPLSGYLWLGVRLWDCDPLAVGESFNFGPDAKVNQSVGELVAALAKNWPGVQWNANKFEEKAKTESNLLKLCCDKALNHLGWHAVMDFADTVHMTAQWYRIFYEQGKMNVQDLAIHQLNDYTAKAIAQGLVWTKNKA